MAEGGTRRDDPKGISGPGSVSSRQDMVLWENTSVETCTVMSWLGYGPEIIQARRNAYRNRDRLFNINTGVRLTWITTGSKAEGLTCYMESDTDLMFLINHVICLEDGVNAYNYPKEITVLRSCNHMSYHGHCRLLLERYGTLIPSLIDIAFCDDGYGRKLLSSDLYFHNLSYIQCPENMVLHDRAGPSRPSTFRGVGHFDTVPALPYCCPNILSRWAARSRHWPPPEVVKQVEKLEAFLTPVGFKGSEYQHVEWRVSFNAGEIELVKNLNDTQIKLYVLLKMVKNDVLNPRKKEVTSYMLKNIVFWIAENNPQSLFHKRSLLHWLHEGLDALRVALGTRELPYYIIPDRNLMAACGLDEEQQRKWISTLTNMMQEGPMMILRLSKIRQALIAHPEPFRWYSRMRTELELTRLMSDNRLLFCRNKNVVIDWPDALLYALHKRIDEIVFEVGQRMIMDGIRVNNMIQVSDGMLR